jgi:hypothetical protein
MFQQYGPHVRVPLEKVHQFGAAIAPVAYDTYGLLHWLNIHLYE